MKHISSLLLLLLLSICTTLSLPQTSSAANNNFIYPAGKSEVAVSQVRIIGKISSSQGQHRISITNMQGTREYTVKTDSQVFSQIVDLTLGNNKVELFKDTTIIDSVEIRRVESFPKDMVIIDAAQEFWPFFLHSKSELTEKCSDCHIANAKTAKQFKQVDQKRSCLTSKCHQGFDKGTFRHGPFQQGSCFACHNPHGSDNKNFLKLAKAELCFSCHADAADMVIMGKFVHFPVKKGECTSCHEPHKSDLEFHLKRGSIKELCAGCHGSTVTNHEILHEPVESGDCNACHSAHISEYKGLLYQGGEELCLTCHEVRKEEFQSKFVHEPVKKSCSLCHDPHGSASPFHLISQKDANGQYIKPVQPMTELCMSCHRTLDPQIVEQIEQGSIKHKPVAEGKCTTCHTPHSTNYKKQLKASEAEVCYPCHKKMQAKIENSTFKHGPIRTNDCGQCHMVHGSNNAKLLRFKFSQKFQSKFNIKNFTLCFNCHNQKIVLEKQTVDTGFRNGKVNLHRLHVNKRRKGRNCNTCHDIHASNQEKHIRSTIPFSDKHILKLSFSATVSGGGCIVDCHKPKQYDRINPVKY